MATYIVFSLILLLFTLAIIKIVKNRKKGVCLGGCAGCSQKGICHKVCDSNDSKNKE